MNRPSSDLSEYADPTGRHPFDDEDISISVEAGVVRMNKATGFPFVRHAAHFESVGQHALCPVFFVTEMGDDFVVSVEPRDPCMQVGAYHDVALDVNIRGKAHVVDEVKMFTVQCEVLQSCVSSVANDKCRIGAVGTIIESESVRSFHFSGLGTAAAPSANPV